MPQLSEEEARRIVRDELLGILKDAHEQLGVAKDPTGFGRKALEGLSRVIRRRAERDDGSNGA